MKFNNKDIDLIETYLNKELGPQEEDAFETRLQTDSDFKELFDEVSILIMGIQQTGREAVLSRLRELDNITVSESINQYKKNSGLRLIRMYSPYAAAAIVFLAAFLWINPGIPLKNYSPYSYNTFRSSGKESTERLHSISGLSDYQEKDYKKTIKKFESIKIKNDTIWFYLGNAYFARYQFKKALSCYEQKPLLNGSELSYDAKWYAALSLIATKKHHKALDYLKDLSESNSIYSHEAHQLSQKRRLQK
ncbi:MAG: hypothetical protein HN936_16695 [Bacteroidetes bacterium]|nr:hypothetical protein [Bacteroidota bacterium]